MLLGILSRSTDARRQPLHLRPYAGVPLCYQVREGGPAGLLLGSVTEEEWRLARVDHHHGKLHLEWRRDREAVARWLQQMTPKHGRSKR